MRSLPLVLVLLCGACGSKTSLSTGAAADGAVDSALDTAVVDTAVDTLVVDTAVDTRPPPRCLSDEECDDGVFCNGLESCNMGGCISGPMLDCVPPPDGCTEGFCDEMLRDCVFVPIDRDADLHLPVSCGGDDCDDEDPTVFGGAPELCDYLDNDCDSGIDERLAYVGLGMENLVSSGVMGAVRPDVEWTGREYQVVYDSDSSSGQVFLTSLRRNGTSRSMPRAVTFSTVLASSADLVWTGSELGMWHHFHLDEAFQGTASLTRLGADGTVIRRAVAATPDVPDADVPSAAWSGSDWGVAFVASLATGAREVRFLRAAADGTVLVMPITLSGSAAIPFVKPSVAWTGRRFVVGWGEGGSVRMAGMRPDGSAVAWTERITSLDQPQVSLEWTGGELAVVYTSTTRVEGVHIAHYSDGGSPTSMIADLTSDTGQQTGVDSVWAGDALAVTYQRTRVADPGTYVVRVGPNARWISEPGLVDRRTANQPGAAITTTGREYGVAYAEDVGGRMAVFFKRVGCE